MSNTTSIHVLMGRKKGRDWKPLEVCRGNSHPQIYSYSSRPKALKFARAMEKDGLTIWDIDQIIVRRFDLGEYLA